MTTMVRRILASSRYFIVVAVVGSFVASAAALVFGGFSTARVVLDAFGNGDFSEKGVKLLAVGLVTIIDRDGLVKSSNGAYVVRDAK